VEDNLDLVKIAAELKIDDSKDLWEYYGNENLDELPEMPQEEFLKVAKRRPRKGV
jgi:hypothetical protein